MIKKELRTFTEEVDIVCCDICERDLCNLDQSNGLYSRNGQVKVLCEHCMQVVIDFINDSN